MRCQWNRPFKTFTIRYQRNTGHPTEWQKYDPADKLSPDYTIQLYPNDNGTIRFGIIRTSLLFEYARAHEKELYVNKGDDGTTFLVVDWSDLAAAYPGG